MVIQFQLVGPEIIYIEDTEWTKQVLLTHTYVYNNNN